MANSSDWLARLAAPAPDDRAWADLAAPDWLAALDAGRYAGAMAGDGFRAALPFGETAPPPPSPPLPEPEPAPDPEPDPAAAAAALAFAEGQAEGRAAAIAEAEAHGARQRALRLTFRALDEAALGVLADDLAATVMALCETVLGEAALDRGALLARCHGAARRIGGAADALTLHLHPDDLAVLGDDALAGWRVVGDAALERGTVLIEGADGSVCDGPAEWRRAIAAAVRG